MHIFNLTQDFSGSKWVLAADVAADSNELPSVWHLSVLLSCLTSDCSLRCVNIGDIQSGNDIVSK